MFPILSFILIFTTLLHPCSSLTSFSITNSPWTPLQNITLTSPSRAYTAGFRPITTTSQLFNFSIWYTNISDPAAHIVVWHANRNSTLSSSASLAITSSGELRLTDGVSTVNLWPTSASGSSNATKLSLGDDGNLVFGTTWASFDHPTDTILQNQTIPLSPSLVSNNGKFMFVNSSSLVYNSSDIYWTTGNSGYQLFTDQGALVYRIGGQQIPADTGSSRFRILKLDDDGNLRIHSFNPNTSEFEVVWQAIQEVCQIHGTCGPNYICMSKGSQAPTCACLPGFEVKKLESGSEVCERKISLAPGAENSRFLQLDYVNFTGGSNQTDTKAPNFDVCQSRCLAKLNCLGFLYKYTGQNYCVLQLDRLSYGYWSPGTESIMFLRVDKSEKAVSNYTGMRMILETRCPVNLTLPEPPNEADTTAQNIGIVTSLYVLELIAGVFLFRAFLKKYNKYRDMAQTLGLELLPAGGPKKFTYAELKAATNDFSNLIGRGGFGDVYKGELPDHRIVAVKRLKKVTGGDGEFWAEVGIIARMHHLNLVRLWGFCAEKGERILVYEYIPNGSLDKFLFRKHHSEAKSGENESESEQKPLLDWSIRYRMAVGVARAIAYLHEECLEWVLHCDIKPENILLGDDFCPKISDFGLAKLKKKADLVTMSRMRGTPGYMAPEWVRDKDPITPKADVYSFGMVLLEIVTGVRNSDIQGSWDSDVWYFPGWAYDKVFKEANVEDILDQQLKNSYDNREHFEAVNRMVKTALWCLQARPEMRPSMGKVMKMLEGTVEIMEPTKPTIFFLGDE